ncbi:MAG: 6-pyruvoyl-tetrahydropterin synthase-related protein, partial [Chloroflexi bacterium]|nr:6-pyruvoyl-tetrahydropterin synthase-related protein [Chloroflexota bacterium]
MSRITTVSKPMNRAVHFFTTSRLTGPALLILICAVAAGGWWNSGLPKGHDALATVCGAASVKDFFMSYGSLWHWSSYGTVSSLFLDSRVLYCVLLIINLLFAWGVAAKILFFTLFALSAISMYFYAHELTGSRPASFVAGLAYVLAPYHLIEVVFEGHWSIGAQYMLTPLVFLAVEKALQQPKMGRIILAGLSLASLIALGHAQTLPILVGPFLALYMVFRVWKSGRERAGLRALTCLSIFLIGLSLTAFWWLPLLREINYFQAPYTLASSESYKATFLQALTLRPSLCCATSSAYGASASGIATVLSFLPFLLAAFGIVLNRKNKYVWFFSALIVITWLLAMGSSSPVPLFTFAERYFPL